MSKAEIERFVKDVKTDTALQAEIKKAGSDPQAFVALAKKKGYDFTVDELKKHAENKKGELSQEDLDKVAGGGVVVTTVLVEVVAT
jgi:predicted ribosomally synthesized peptide with nif11-like leader